MNKFRFLVTIFLLFSALALIFTDKGQEGLPTTMIASVCAYWLSSDRNR